MRIFRILDANINRACEGLRVLEDIARFQDNDKRKTAALREMRHTIRELFRPFDRQLLCSRNSVNGPAPETDGVSPTRKGPVQKEEKKSHDDSTRITANFKRTEEALRSLEENSKLLRDKRDIAAVLEQLRFEVYRFEQQFFHKALPVGLYCITASHLSRGRSTPDVVKAMLDGGAKIVQYREKYKTIGEKYREAEILRRITEEYGASFIINDHPEIALAIDADGVHAGQDDLPIHALRQILGNKIIGISTHSPEQAQRAIAEGADYIGVGPIYPTQTKEDVCAAVGLEYAKYALSHVSIPFVAIGGIKEGNLEALISLGIRTVAMVSDITEAQNITEKVRRLNQKIEKSNK